MSGKVTLTQLIELARQADPEPIDFGMIEIDEDEVYNRIAIAAVESFNRAEPETKDVVYLASIINLHVKNYVLSMENSTLLSTIHKLTNKNKG